MHRRIKMSAAVIIVAVVAILLNGFGTGSGSSNMIPAAAVARAGAIEIPSEPPVGRAVS